MIEKVGIDFPERRSCRRARGMLPGSVSYGDKEQCAECIILDISVTGAKIRLRTDVEAERIKRNMRLRLKIGTRFDFPIDVVWGDGTYLGLRFLTDPSHIAAALENLVRADTIGETKGLG